MATIAVSDFIAASKSYVQSHVRKANTDKNPYLTMTEAKALPRDLRDNYEHHRVGGQKNGRVTARKFEEKYVAYVAVQAKRVARHDGILGARQIAKLPADLRDNAKAFAAATNTLTRRGSYVAATKGELIRLIESAVEKKDWTAMLPLFDRSNRKDQAGLGINDYQYIAEGLGLHMVDNKLPGAVTRRSTLDTIESVRINPAEVSARGDEFQLNGTATLNDGSKRKVNLFVTKTAEGFTITPPVG